MSGPVLTEVSAVVAIEREGSLLAGFRDLLVQPMPDGLLRTELLRGQDGHWRIQTLWRDRAALDAMRAGPQPPAAPQLFRRVGADPVLAVFEIAESHPSPVEPA
jgi:hypothetical protein